MINDFGWESSKKSQLMRKGQEHGKLKNVIHGVEKKLNYDKQHKVE